MCEHLRQRVEASIARHGLLRGGEGVMAAVSGGPDSVCMLDVLAGMRERLGLTLVVGHVNHELRRAAAGDARHVERLAERLGLPCEVMSVDVRALAKAEKLSLEHAAREARYRALEEMAERNGITCIAVAHTADDQVETIILNLLRGGGPEGLAGMPLSRPFFSGGAGHVIRPLIDITKAETEAYCREQGLETRLDKTNLHPVALRNRIRHTVIPVLTREQPALAAVLLRQAEIFRAEDEFLRMLTSDALKAVAAPAPPEGIALDIGRLGGLPLPLARRVVREVLRSLRAERTPLGLEQVERALNLAMLGKTGKRISLRGGLWAEREYERLILRQDPRHGGFATRAGDLGLSADTKVALRIPGKVSIAGRVITAERVKREAVADLTADEGGLAAFVDAAVLSGNVLTVRPARPGDRFIPLGSSGSMKLQDFFVNRKVPRGERTGALLVCDNDRIVWLVGWRLDERAKVLDTTTTIVRLTAS